MASKFKDISEQKFGKLTAKRRTDKKINSFYIWNCQCDCGKECEVSINSLTQGKTKSCGCLRTPDFSGEKIGRLKVLGIHSRGKSILWECLCDCGNTTTATTSQLKPNSKAIKRSCGCLEKENKEKIAGHNFVDISGKRFSNLLVLGKSGQKNKSKEILWDCLCDCGKKTKATGGHLKSGHTKSCGCLLEKAKEKWKKISQSEKAKEKSKATFLENDGIEQGTSLSSMKNAKVTTRKDNKTGVTGVCYNAREKNSEHTLHLKGSKFL